jgi:serine/threonine-protein kinase
LTYTSGADHCGLDGSRLLEGDQLEGRIIGQSIIEAPLGMGGVSIVYRARHASLGTPVAVKLLLGETATRPVIAERFRREAQATSRIIHPNVVRVLDFGTTHDGLTFIAMEHLEGRTLAEVIAEGPIPDERCRRIGADIARGLEAAHRLGFLHRDLKPGNVMLVEEAGREVAKILDFGLVGLADEAVGPRLTQQGTLMGTPHYLAPELLEGHGASTRSDAYAFGVTLYEMVAGRPPFEGDTLHEVMAGHLSKAATPIATGGPAGPLALRLIEKDPAVRPSLTEAIAILEERRPSRRRPIAVGLALAAILLFSGIGARELGSGAPRDPEAVNASFPPPPEDPPLGAPIPVAPPAALTPPVEVSPKEVEPARARRRRRAHVQAPAMVELASDPSGATVRLEGQGVLGRTPMEAILEGEQQWLIFEHGGVRRRVRWRRGTERVKVSL